jgi:hypothetical protein
MMPRRAEQHDSIPEVSQGRYGEEMDGVNSEVSKNSVSAPAVGGREYTSTLLVHFLECDSSVVRDLLRSQLKVPHTYPVLQDSRQLDLIHKMVVLKNRVFAKVTGKEISHGYLPIFLVLRYFSHFLRLHHSHIKWHS